MAGPTNPQLVLTASFEDAPDLGARRTFGMYVKDATPTRVVIDVADDTSPDGYAALVDPDTGRQMELVGLRATKNITCASHIMRYRVLSGSTDIVVWCDAEQDPGALKGDKGDTGATGPAGPNYTVTTTKTTTYTAAIDELVQADPTSAGFTITLPAVSVGNKGHRVAVKNVTTSTNTITIARAGSDTIDGGTSVTITTSKGKVVLVSDGASNWLAM